MKTNKVLYREIFAGSGENEYCRDLEPFSTYLHLGSAIVPTTKAWVKKKIADSVEDSDVTRENAAYEVEKWWKRQRFTADETTTEEDRKEYLLKMNLTEKTIADIGTINTKCKIWSRKEWEKFLPQLFLEKKDKYDQTKFKIIRISRDQQKLANELYHRIKAKENTFEEIAEEYGHGKERIKNGCIQKMRLNAVSPKLVDKLRQKEPGHLIPPFRVNEWYIMIEIIASHSAKLDEATEGMLIEEAFESFLTYSSNQLIQKLIKEIH